MVYRFGCANIKDGLITKGKFPIASQK
jgi:hypothetical protein